LIKATSAPTKATTGTPAVGTAARPNTILLVGWLFGIGSSLAGGMVTPLARSVIVGGMEPSTLLVLRLTLATILLGTTMAIVAPHKLKISKRGLWLMLVVGGLAGLEIASFFWALAYVDAATTSIIKSVQPLVVLLLLTLAGERMTGKHWSRVILSMVGIYLLVGIGGKIDPFGVFLIGISLIFYALQLAQVQWWLQEYDTWTVAFYLTGIMSIVVTGWWAATGAPWQMPTLTEIIIIVVLAVVGTYFARLALFAAIARIGSGQIALLWPLQTLTAIVIAVIFLNERLTPIQWFGGALVLAATFLALPGVRLRRIRLRPESSPPADAL
jgi:drug/metabolite transporter (DMT)-like permease